MSGIVIKIFGIRRSSNNGKENWFNFVKNVEFAHKIKILIPRIIQRHEECWLGRLKEVIYGLQTTRQMERRNKLQLHSLESSGEIKSSTSTKSNHYFKISSSIDNMKLLNKQKLANKKNSRIITIKPKTQKPFSENLVFDDIVISRTGLNGTLR